MPFNGTLLPGLKAARLRKALTQEELAAASGIGRTTLARLETGAPASPGSARKLARALGVEPDALMEPATFAGHEPVPDGARQPPWPAAWRSNTTRRPPR